MQGMQERILDAIEAEITSHKLDPVVKEQWANTGRVYGMDGLDVIVEIEYDFNDSYAGLHISSPLVLDVGLVDGGPEDASYRIKGDGKVSYWALKYTEGTRIKGAVAMVGTIIDKARGLA